LILFKLIPPEESKATKKEPFCPFGLGRFMGMDQGYYGFQWLANYSNTPHGVRRLGWVSKRDNKHYYKDARITPKDVPLTHEYTETWLSKSDILAQGFKLETTGKPSMKVFHFLSESKDVDWSHPDRRQLQRGE
jgi:hypothetical protein